eukprot:Clim_evm16s78 gene=Clim_evmTU16s78
MADEDDKRLVRRFQAIKHVILVLSGKGGVGKSTVSTQLALSLASKGKKVGLLDLDITGPSVPRMLGLDTETVHQSSDGWVPIFAKDTDSHLRVMSIGFLTGGGDEAIVWRGPKKTAMVKQFLTEVYWGDLDYLIIDTPPGTSDEHISVVENLRKVKPSGAVVITTPQNVALADVRKELNFCKRAKVNVLGVVENMSGFVCPHCSECTAMFAQGGGKAVAEQFSVPYLGHIPLEPQLTAALDAGKPYAVAFSDAEAAKSLSSIVCKLEEALPTSAA